MNPFDLVLAVALIGLGVFFVWCGIDAYRHPERWS